jgi:hypothetical protein
MRFKPAMTTRRRAASAALALHLAAGAAGAQVPASAPGAPTPAAPEFELKAAFVFNFAVFTQWPAETLAAGAVLNLCTYPSNSMLPALGALHDKRINGHKIGVHTLSPNPPPAALRECQILVLDGADREHWNLIRRELAGASVLVVTDDPVIGGDGSAIALGVDGQRIGFDVNLNAARLARLNLSAKLLRLARSVR